MLLANFIDAAKAFKRVAKPFMAAPPDQRAELLAHYKNVAKEIYDNKGLGGLLTSPALVEIISDRLRSEENPNTFTGLSFHGKTTIEFQKACLEGWENVPLSFKKYMASRNVQVMAGDIMTAMVPKEFLDNKMHTPSSSDDREWINEAEGVFVHSSNTAYISEHYATGLRGKQPIDITTKSILNNQWTKSSTVASTLTHEVGHAIDRNMGYYIGNDISNAQEFIKNYEADLSKFGNTPTIAFHKARQSGYGYFVRDDLSDKGRGEMFAELFAQIHGGSTMGIRIAKDWPRCYAFVQKFSNEFDQAYALGERQVFAEMHKYCNEKEISEPNATSDHIYLRRKLFNADFLKDKDNANIDSILGTLPKRIAADIAWEIALNEHHPQQAMNVITKLFSTPELRDALIEKSKASSPNLFEELVLSQSPHAVDIIKTVTKSLGQLPLGDGPSNDTTVGYLGKRLHLLGASDCLDIKNIRHFHNIKAVIDAYGLHESKYKNSFTGSNSTLNEALEKHSQLMIEALEKKDRKTEEHISLPRREGSSIKKTKRLYPVLAPKT